MQYEPVVQKASEWLVQMEHQTGLLSAPDGQAKMPDVLQDMLQGLNSGGYAVLSVGEQQLAHGRRQGIAASRL